MKQVFSLPVLTMLTSQVLLSGCGEQKFLNIYPDPQPQRALVQPLKEIKFGGSVDLLWVIDDSGSMMDYQKAVIQNAELFMDNFIKTQLDWKMGLISTDEDRSPVIGFTPATLLDSHTPQPVDRFKNAVAQLGTNGSAEEMAFNPLLNAFTKYPDFLRGTSPLAIIIVTDAPEQSGIAAQAFLAKFQALIGSTRPIYVYGVFAVPDLGCRTSDDQWAYKGSPYEEFLLSATAGQTYPLCSPDFGQNLAAIGQSIANRVTRPTIYLERRPRISTLKVSYKGKLLPPGPEKKGGAWFYDYGLNAVVFYGLDFVDYGEDVTILYDDDDGSRETEDETSAQ